MTDKETKYCATQRVVNEGELVITTKNPSKRFYGACSIVDKKKFVLVGVVVTGHRELCSMDVTNRQDLEKFLEGVGSIYFIKPVGGVVYKLPIEKAEELRTSYKRASIVMGRDEFQSFLDGVGMDLSGGLMTNFAFRSIPYMIASR